MARCKGRRYIDKRQEYIYYLYLKNEECKSLKRFALTKYVPVMFTEKCHPRTSDS